MLKPALLMFATAILMIGCSNDGNDQDSGALPPWVMTVAPQPQSESALRLSGTVRARHEVPLSFQVGGRILERKVDAGERVTPDQVLFTLDPRDFDEAVRVADAQAKAVQAALDTAASDLRRQQQLVEKNFVSRQTLEQYQLAVREAQSRVNAAAANLAQARNARAYARLASDRAGILIYVSGEPGQVVAMGQTVALLAEDGEREVEVFLPDGSRVPAAGEVLQADGSTRRLALREVAGAADPASRSWRARYRLESTDVGDLPLGAVVQVVLNHEAVGDGALNDTVFAVPPAALDERGDGPRIWIVSDERAEPLPVTVVRLTPDQALIQADLDPEARIIALGAHLVNPGMAVRERAR